MQRSKILLHNKKLWDTSVTMATTLSPRQLAVVHCDIVDEELIYEQSLLLGHQSSWLTISSTTSLVRHRQEYLTKYGRYKRENGTHHSLAHLLTNSLTHPLSHTLAHSLTHLVILRPFDFLVSGLVIVSRMLGWIQTIFDAQQASEGVPEHR